MGQFATYFSEYPVGSQPSDWSKTIGAPTCTVREQTGALGGKALQVVGTGGNICLSWDAPGAALGDVEVLGLVTVSDKAAAPGLWARQTGSDAGYHAWLSAGGQASIRKFNTGGGWNEVTYTNFAWSANTLYCIRFRLQGTSLKMRVWAYGEPEPDTWLLSAVDSTLASGRAGVGSQTSGTRHYQYFSVGTNGDQALLPGASSGGGRIRRANLRMMGLVV